MKTAYNSPAMRRRMAEFLGGEEMQSATAVYITHSGVAFDSREVPPPVELCQLLDRDLDVARSLADEQSYLLHLDVEHVNFDSSAEGFVDPWRTFGLQEPLVRVIESLLLGWNIRPLHLLTGQGHHFVWRIRRSSMGARELLALAPAPELVGACIERVPPLLAGSIAATSQRVFSAIALLAEFMAHRIKELASPLCALPVEITAVHVGPVGTLRREILSIDTSEYGDPLHTRMIRMPFSRYLKPWSGGLARSLGLEHEIPFFFRIPMHEMDHQQAIKVRQVEDEVCELEERACVRIPLVENGTACLLDDYLASGLRRFHECFYSAGHDAREEWWRTYDRTPLDTMPYCARHVLEQPNDLLLRPAGMQLITRVPLAAGWHPRHIAGLIWSKFENPAFGWGGGWRDYEPGTRADFYTRVFSGLLHLGLDRLADFNCVSTQEKGFCFPPPQGTCGTSLQRQTAVGGAARRLTTPLLMSIPIHCLPACWFALLLVVILPGCAGGMRTSERMMWSTYALATQQGDATCFIIRDPRTGLEGDEGAVVFTSTHVLRSVGSGPVVISLRMQDPTSAEVRVVMLGFVPPKTRDGRTFYVRHPRHDLAAFSLHIPPEFSWLLSTRSVLGRHSVLRAGSLLHTGDEVSFLGYPEVLPGTGGAFPILRSGRVASYPVGNAQSGGRFVLDADVYPGDSGAPVFLSSRSTRPRLAGMIIERIGATNTSFSHLAVAVDADAIRETLDLLVASQRDAIHVKTPGRALLNPSYSIP